MCGENTAALPAPPPFHGSPPRVRGKRNKVVTSTSDQRITPACAGKTESSAPVSGRFTDHPRVCGENDIYLRGSTRFRGSPPRVRGKPAHLYVPKAAPRITPACAGKTDSGSGAGSAGTDHPRVCGENRLDYADLWTYGGSPPRVRGKQAFLSRRGLWARITPACAGKTRSVTSVLPSSSDHPRVCGENCSFAFLTSVYFGSPPRVRGKPRSAPVKIQPRRITPACAGKTTGLSEKALSVSDHPRVCGENYKRYGAKVATDGSPPRVRGKRCH